MAVFSQHSNHIANIKYMQGTIHLAERFRIPAIDAYVNWVDLGA